MASATTTRPTTAGLHPYRLTIPEYLALGSAGTGLDHPRVELLDGIIVQKMTRYAPHVFTVLRVAAFLRQLMSADHLISEEKPVELSPRWLPEPDIAVLVGPDTRYEGALPAAQDVALIVEVSDSTYRTDRGIKWRKYAAARVPTYWIVNLSKRQVEVFQQPVGTGTNAAYNSIEVFGTDSSVPVVIADQEVGRLNVADLLPTAAA